MGKEKIIARYAIGHKDVGGWDYDLPKDYGKFDTPAPDGDHIEIITPSGEVLGYACKLFYIVEQTVYETYEEAWNDLYFDIHTYIKCRKEDIEYALKKMQDYMDSDNYGD
jgi:hypothetical protein